MSVYPDIHNKQFILTHFSSISQKISLFHHQNRIHQSTSAGRRYWTHILSWIRNRWINLPSTKFAKVLFGIIWSALRYSKSFLRSTRTSQNKSALFLLLPLALQSVSGTLPANFIFLPWTIESSSSDSASSKIHQ